MLALTIREKNGEERQLIFEKEEVTIGRATGSDIVLPRSNISKRHARLVDKHDKVVIVDLRSTNGTYVNGRRITAPELLTHEDKVYIGDFVIRLSRPAEQHPSQRMSAPYTASPTPPEPRASRAATSAVDPIEAYEEEMPEAEVYDAAPAPPPFEATLEEDDSTRAIAAIEDDEPPPPPKKAAVAPRAAAPVPMPPAPAPKDIPLPPTAPPARQAAPLPQPKPKPAVPMPPTPPQPAVAPPQPAPVAPAKPQPTSRSARPMPGEDGPTMAVPVARKAPPPPPPPEPEPEPYVEPEPEPYVEPEPEIEAYAAAEADPWAEWNSAIEAVVSRIERDQPEVAPSDVEAVVADAIAQAIDDGAIAAETDRDALAQDVTTELIGLGPLAELIDDPSVRAIAINGVKAIYVDRGGEAPDANGRVFATARSYRAALARLAGRDPEPLADMLGLDEHRLGDGSVLRFVGTGGTEPLAVWRRAATEAPLLADLVAEGTLDQAHAQVLGHALAAHKNVLVCGAPTAGRGAFGAAIAAELGLDKRVVLVGDGSSLALAQRNVARLGAQSLVSAGHLAALDADLVVFERLDASLVADWIEASLSGSCPVLAFATEMNPERALKRLGLALELGSGSHGRGATIVGEAVDLVVALHADANGVTRVDKVHEVEGQKDGFALKAPARR